MELLGNMNNHKKVVYAIWAILIMFTLLFFSHCKKGIRCDYVGRVNGIEVSRVYEFTMSRMICWKDTIIMDTVFKTECKN